MRKSLAIIASALLLAVAAATHDRLRYDSTVFADAAVAGVERAKRIEYPPCKTGVREDRCIQLYERGVKRSYQRWLAAHNQGAAQASADGPARTYRPCRGRNDDRCQQRAATRQARAARRAERRAAARRAPAQTRAATRTAVRQQRPTTQPQATRAATQQRAVPVQRQATRAPTPQPRSSGRTTPGI